MTDTRGSRRYSEAEITRIVELLRAGYAIEQIAALFPAAVAS